MFTTQPKPRKQTRKLTLQALESRTMMAADCTVPNPIVEPVIQSEQVDVQTDASSRGANGEGAETTENSAPSALSTGPLCGGMQQRVAFARAMLHAPQVLVVDEPLCDLDPESVDKILRELVLPPGCPIVSDPPPENAPAGVDQDPDDSAEDEEPLSPFDWDEIFGESAKPDDCALDPPTELPKLEKLPYLNRLFRNVGVERETSSLLMMVTPRIIIQDE